MPGDEGPKPIGASGRYYETMAFGAIDREAYIEADVKDQRDFESEWAICAESLDEIPDDVDNRANEMHDAVVAEFVARMAGKTGGVSDDRD